MGKLKRVKLVLVIMSPLCLCRTETTPLICIILTRVKRVVKYLRHRILQVHLVDITFGTRQLFHCSRWSATIAVRLDGNVARQRQKENRETLHYSRKGNIQSDTWTVQFTDEHGKMQRISIKTTVRSVAEKMLARYQTECHFSVSANHWHTRTCGNAKIH